ncbi:phage tail tape measure protein [uncultured Stenotrophomonas sp.]|uniref:phage tail tape measure protein n=1 Tax=uncultured Stenotrophomonas sp. TaxID=165438 RepID=UPI0025D7957A|nr:phage tail tape measure protein [uncultured Stenotrophomonas sp.]
MSSTVTQIDVTLRANTAAFRAEMALSGRVSSQQLALIRKEASQTAASISNFNKTAVGFPGFDSVKTGVTSLIEAQRSIQQIHQGLRGATGSAQAADKAYGFIAQTSKSLGLNLEEASRNFTRLSAAATANGVAMEDQQALFLQLSRSATAMNLSSDQVGRATDALGASFSSGTFQADALRKQLGEVIPGVMPRFMQAVAQMNEGTALAGKSFDTMLRDGDLGTRQYLPAMIQALTATGAGAEDAAATLDAELNRLSTAWFNFKVKVSDGLFSDAAIASARFMADNLEGVAGAAQLAVGALAGRILGVGAGKAYGAVSAPISERSTAASQAAEMAGLARERAREAAEQVNQARESIRLTTTWKAQAAAAQDTARGQLQVAASAQEAAQRTLEHQQGAATLSSNLRAQQEAQVAAAIAQRNLARAQAEYNAATASGVRADAAATAAKGRLILAQEAAAVATHNLGLARGRESAASSAASVGGMAMDGLRGAGSGLLALAGGPWGAAAMAIGALGVAYADAQRKAEQARKEFDAQVRSMATLRVEIQDTTDQLGRMDGSKSLGTAAQDWNRFGVDVRAADAKISQLKSEIAGYESKVASARSKAEIGAGGGPDLVHYGNLLQDAKDRLKNFADEAAPAREAFVKLEAQLRTSMDPELFEKMRAASIKANDVDFSKLLAGLSDVERRGLSATIAIAAISSAGQDEVWKRQVARLRREKGDYQAWLAEQAKGYKAATGASSYEEAFARLKPEELADFQARAKFIREDIAAEKAWNAQRQASARQAPAASGGAGKPADAYATLLDRIKRQIDLDKQQMLVSDDMTAVQKLQVNTLEELRQAKSKLSDEEQRSILLMLDSAVAGGRQLAAMEAQRKGAKDLQQLQMQLDESSKARDASNSADLFALGHTAGEVDKRQRRQRIEDDFSSQTKALNERNVFGQSDMASYWLQFGELEKKRDADLAAEKAYQASRSEALGSWATGAGKAFREYAEQAANVAELSNQAFTKAFQGMEDALVSFVTTGKMDFGKLAESIIADLTRIAAKQAISGMMGAMGANGENTGTLFTLLRGFMKFDKGGYTGPGGRFEPAGIVHKGEGVLNQDDMRALGGPSAFHALRRSLHSSGGGSATVGQVASPLSLGGTSTGIAVEINNYGSGQVKAREETQDMGDGNTLRKLVIDIVGESLDGGQLGNVGRRRYGWSEVVG